MRIHGIRDKTFPSPVPQLKKNYKNGTLTKTRIRSDNFISAPKVSAPFFTFSTAAPQSPVRLYLLFRESRIRSEILPIFCYSVPEAANLVP